MSSGLQKDFDKIIRRLRRTGYRIEVGGNGHYIVRSKDGAFLASLPASAGDQRALKNAMAQLRRSGIEYAPRKGKVRRTEPKGGE